MLSKIDDDVTLINPQKELDKGAEKAEVYQPILLEAQWQTPIFYLFLPFPLFSLSPLYLRF